MDYLFFYVKKNKHKPKPKPKPKTKNNTEQKAADKKEAKPKESRYKR